MEALALAVLRIASTLLCAKFTREGVVHVFLVLQSVIAMTKEEKKNKKSSKIV